MGFYEAGNRSEAWQTQAKGPPISTPPASIRCDSACRYDHLDFSQLQQYTGPTFTAPNGQQTATGAVVEIIPDPGFGQIYHVLLASLTSSRPTTQNYSAFFVEDSWKIGNSLTIRPGVRYEQETLSGTLIKDFSLKNNWAPRIGVVWDPTRTGKGKVFGNFGRYYARVPSDLAARALSSDALLSADYFDANLTKPVPDGTVTTNATNGKQTITHFRLLGAGGDTIDPNAKLSYYNEWVVGSEYAVLKGIDVGVRYIHRDIGRVLEDVQAYPVVATSLGVDGAATANYLLTNPGPNTPVVQIMQGTTVKFESPVHDYNAVEFTANRRFAESLGAGGVVSLVAADRELRGLLPQRQRPVGSGDLVALRLPDQRPDVHGDRRAGLRLLRRHPVPRLRGRRAAAAGPDARRQGVWHIPV